MLNKYLKLLFIAGISFIFPCFVNAAVFLDGSTNGCNNGSTNYSPVSRSCGSGSDTVYLDLLSFQNSYIAGATNYIRAGNYFRDSTGNPPGSLVITRGGSLDSPTIIKAYLGEEREVFIGSATRGATYQSSPGSRVVSESARYYPNPAISIYDAGASYTTIDGLKTFGQINVAGAHDVILINNDFGGGGPTEAQGNVVRLNTTYNTIVRNNLIHNSCIALENDISPVDENGAGLIIYAGSALIEKNTFFDNWGGNVFNKDNAEQNGKTVEIRNNFFGPSEIFPNVTGIRGNNFQGMQLAANLYHNNIFFNQNGGAFYPIEGAISTNVFYNNTIIGHGIEQAVGGVVAYPINIYNNLFYIASSGTYEHSYYMENIADSDYNLFYFAGNWKGGYDTIVATTLSGWQSYSGFDENSISSNPSFINASGVTPTDFKRTSYAENFSSSSYGIYAGAYETGNEQIGADWYGVADVVAPNNPRGLSVL